MSDEVFGAKAEEQFADFGALGYDDREMCAVLGVTKARLAELKKLGGADAFARGAATLQFEIDRRLVQKAATGDTEAIKVLELRRARLS